MRHRKDAYQVTRAAFALLALGFNMIVFFGGVEPNWIAVSGLTMQGIAAVMCVLEV